MDEVKKVICICNKSTCLPLTLGKMYYVIQTLNIPFSKSRIDDPCGLFYKVECDGGEEKWIDAVMFRELTLDEKRDLKIRTLVN